MTRLGTRSLGRMCGSLENELREHATRAASERQHSAQVAKRASARADRTDLKWVAFRVASARYHPGQGRRAVSSHVDRRRAHAGAGTTAARSRCSQAEEDLLRMPRNSQAAR